MPQEQTFILNCPHCSGQVECNIEWINRRGECPYCHNKFIIQQPVPGPGPAATAAASYEDTQRESSGRNLEESQDEAIKREICEFLAAILIKLIRKLDQGTEVEFYMLCCAFFAFNMKELISTHFRLPQDEVIVQSVNDIIKRSPDSFLLITAQAFFFKWAFYKTVHESGDEREKARFAKLTEEVEGEPLNDMTFAAYLTAIEMGCSGVLKSASKQEKLAAMQAMRSIARKGMASIERGEVVDWNKVELP